jgi:hypothetical protein
VLLPLLLLLPCCCLVAVALAGLALLRLAPRGARAGYALLPPSFQTFGA